MWFTSNHDLNLWIWIIPVNTSGEMDDRNFSPKTNVLPVQTAATFMAECIDPITQLDMKPVEIIFHSSPNRISALGTGQCRIETKNSHFDWFRSVGSGFRIHVMSAGYARKNIPNKQTGNSKTKQNTQLKIESPLFSTVALHIIHWLYRQINCNYQIMLSLIWAILRVTNDSPYLYWKSGAEISILLRHYHCSKLL